MLVHEVLEACRQGGVLLRIAGDRLVASPRQSVTPKLHAGIMENREALKAIVGAKSWPFLGQPGFVLAKARCKCGDDPCEFSERGEPVCREPERPGEA